MTNKTLKKITLKKETISSLNDNQMNTVDGGTGGCWHTSLVAHTQAMVGCVFGDSEMFGNCYTGFGGWC